ncbi:MAG TPA: hypothetical protein VFV75_17650 [Candidatus Polarisedimenticolaceae bacterium]|nr:hypothetical protein [Candidatus Polarisedimenticolaceae bacterium]
MRGRHWASLAPWLLVPVYLAALAYRRDTVPAGLCNDAAEEALRGVLLLAQHRLEPITHVLGNSAETLYLYLVGFSTQLLGPTTLAVQVVSWTFACGVVGMTAAVVRRVDPEVPPIVPLSIAATSVWLFHYGRAGLRAISAPLFLLLFVFFALRAEERRRDAVLAGAALALGVYGYTAFRAVALAGAVWVLWRAVRTRDWKPAAALLGTALVVSIPNLVLLAQDPRHFLLRGSYVAKGGELRNVAATALMPFVYPAEYRDVNGPHHFFDGVSAGVTRAGVHPVHPLVAVLFLAGLWIAVRRRLGGPLLLCGAGTVLLVGTAGPSLTRLLVALPVVLVLASLAAARLPAWLFLVGILAVAGTHAHAYFVRFASDSLAQFNFSPAATPIGQRAAELERSGARVLCVLGKDANVVHFLAPRAAVAEFYFRPYQPRDLPAVEPDVVLVEGGPRFAAVARTFPRARVEVGPAALQSAHAPDPVLRRHRRL